MASGERRVSELKYIRFKQTFKLPNNSDIEKITAKFEGEILYVIVPKVKEQKEEPKEENGTASTVAEENVNEKPNKGDDKQGENIDGERNKQCEGVDKVFKEKLGRDAGLLECVISKLRKNKGIVMTAVLAFSLGVFITRKFESGGEWGSCVLPASLFIMCSYPMIMLLSIVYVHFGMTYAYVQNKSAS